MEYIKNQTESSSVRLQLHRWSNGSCSCGSTGAEIGINSEQQERQKNTHSRTMNDCLQRVTASMMEQVYGRGTSKETVGQLRLKAKKLLMLKIGSNILIFSLKSAPSICNLPMQRLQPIKRIPLKDCRMKDAPDLCIKSSQRANKAQVVLHYR